MKEEKRQKFEPQSVLLRTMEQVYLVIAKVKQVPLDDDKPLEVLIREQPKQRGLDQNAYYHMRIGEIEKQGWFNCRQYSHDVWHEYCKRHVMDDVIIDKKGVERSKWTELPSGEKVVISTVELEKGCFAKYTTMVEAFGASLGVQFSARPPNRG